MAGVLIENIGAPFWYLRGASSLVRPLFLVQELSSHRHTKIYTVMSLTWHLKQALNQGAKDSFAWTAHARSHAELVSRRS